MRDRPVRLGEERVQDASHLMPDGAHDLQDCNTASLACERYLEGRLEIHLHVTVRLLEGDDADYCVVFEAMKGKADIHSPRRLNAPEGKPLIAGHRQPDNRKGEGLVFIKVVQLLEPEERLVPSFVWLQASDNCKCFAGQSLAKGAYETGFLIEPTLVGDDGELDNVVVWRNAAPTVADSQLVDEVIEGTPIIEDGISGLQCPVGEVGGINKTQAETVLSAFSITLGDDSVGAGFDPSVEITLQRLEMFVAPVELGVRPGGCVHNGPTLGSP